MEQSKVVVLIACHKRCFLPRETCFLPVEVGAALHERAIPGCIPDNGGDNISRKNPNYCELTALYWAWKNVEAEYIGLVHYRRYFAAGFPRRIAGTADYEKLLSRAPLILPFPRHYVIETNYSQYIHAHHEQDLATACKVLAEQYPEYLPAYEHQMSRRSGHRFNMFIMRCDLFDTYCTWLFSILFEIERRLDIRDYDPYSARVFGFIAERLLDVWIETKGLQYIEMPVLYTERQNWIKKGTRFIMRKVHGRRNTDVRWSCRGR
jgi:hypothetical protein